MTYHRLVLLPEAALHAPLDDYGSNLKVHHSSDEVIGRMFRPTGSDGDAKNIGLIYDPPFRQLTTWVESEGILL